MARVQQIRWLALTRSDVDAKAKAVSAKLLEERLQAYRTDPDRNVKLLQKAKSVHEFLPRVRRIAEASQSEPGMSIASPADFDRDPLSLGVHTGVLELNPGKLIQSRPELMTEDRRHKI